MVERGKNIFSVQVCFFAAFPVMVSRCAVGELRGRNLCTHPVCPPGSPPGYRGSDAGAAEGALRNPERKGGLKGYGGHLEKGARARKLTCIIPHGS